MENKLEFIRDLAKQVNDWLCVYFNKKQDYNKKIYEAMSYSIEAGGKRIRPLFTILTYSLYKADYKKILPVAASIEMIHTYSLIHDDLPSMDDDDLRRGLPTNHKVFGEAIAILAGDGLLNEAMNIMLQYTGENLNEDSVNACRYISFSSGVEGMIGGQTVDILSENNKISMEKLYYMHSKKTGALIKAAIVSGAMLAGATDNDVKKLELYGDSIGLAFQIKDDILDIVGETKTLGKKAKSDIKSNKTTFVSEYGIEKCEIMCKKLTKECIDILKSINRDTEVLQWFTNYLLDRKY